MKVQRNDRCSCGSGKKYKHCCEGKTPWYRQATWTGALVILVLLGTAIVVWTTMSQPNDVPGAAQDGKVWSPEHGHYH